MNARSVSMEEHVKPNILLVDDRPENLLALEAIMEGVPCTIFKAHSGQEALWLVLHQQIDLVLLDVQMPEMDGFEVARMIHSKKATKDIQIIFITAISKEQKYVEKGYEMGAVNYLFKPIDPDELKNKVNVALRWSTYQKKIRALEARKSSSNP
jgi:response regulator RpfG family c-di-GMP phosphodiesterase